MARVRSLSQMRLDCRRMANMENSTFVSDAELTEYVNQGLAELWRRLVPNEGAPHIRCVTTIAVVAHQSIYSLPSDFWELQSAECTYNGITTKMRPFMNAEHARFSNPYLYTDPMPAKYRVQASNIEFLPATQSYSVSVYYTPCQLRLVADTDTVDGYNGYEIAAIYGAVATMLAKEESDASFWIAQQERVYQQIETLAGRRDAGEPERVQDVTGGLGSPFGPWWTP